MSEEPNCDNCWKKGNYDVFMCPTKEKCIPARDYSPKGPEERVRGDAKMSEGCFCVNCNNKKGDFVCEDCIEKNLKTHENKLISKIVNDLKKYTLTASIIEKWEGKLK